MFLNFFGGLLNNLDWPSFIVVTLLSFFGLAFVFVPLFNYFWKNVNLSWLNYSTLFIVITLPFERLPSLELFNFTFRFSQLFTLFTLALFLALLIQGKLQNHKWNPLGYWLFALVTASIPSLFFVEDWSRFTVTSVATIIVFIAAFLISNFLISRRLAFFGLILSLFLVSIFGYFQLFADLLGFPTSVTFLKETYTKKVFGFPRVHSTAAEPLYFAGMLFLPIYASLLFYLKSITNLQFFTKLKSNLNSKLGSDFSNTFLTTFSKFYPLLILINLVKNVPKYIADLALGFLIFFSILFTITIAKGAWLALLIGLVFLSLFTWKKFNWLPLISKLILAISLALPVLYISSLTFPPVQQSLNKVVQNFSETASGVSSTSTERANFQDLAVSLLSENIVMGIGSGQYGIISERPLRSLKTSKDQFFIVNNVYLEIWLEEGLLFLFIFLAMWLWVIISSLQKLYKLQKLSVENIMELSIIIAIISYLIQWQTFSPIYIMPIFILLGLAANFNKFVFPKLEVINLNKKPNDNPDSNAHIPPSIKLNQQV